MHSKMLDQFLKNIKKLNEKKKLVQTIKFCIVGEPMLENQLCLNNIFKKKLSIVSRKSQTTIKQKTGVFLLIINNLFF